MAKQRSKKASSTGSEEFEVAPFTFEGGPSETSVRSKSTTGTLPSVPLGQFGDAEMEFEPFMFDPGEKGQGASQGMNVEGGPSGFSFEPFSSGGAGMAVESMADTSAAQGSPIVGGDLPLPAYFSPSQFEADEPAASTQESWAGEKTATMGVDNTTSGLVLPTGPMSVAGGDTGGLGMGRGDQMTGRTPTGPIPGSATPSTPLSLPATSPVTSLGRTRGNTGPLGPLPPDRNATPNASWSDSSLASIEDFSSILIAMRAGKKLRQSGPMQESMVSQEAAPTMEASSQAVQQVEAPVAEPVVEQAVEAEPVVETPKATTPSMVDAFDHPSDNSDMPEWAKLAAQGSAVMKSYAEADAAAEAEAKAETDENAPSVVMGTAQLEDSGEAEGGEAADGFSWVTGHMDPSHVVGETGVGAGVEGAMEMAPEMQAVVVEDDAPVMVAEPEPEAPPMSATAAAAKAELERRKTESEKTPSNLEPEVVEALRQVEPVLASGSLTGDEIEFEGFMFNKGASSPLTALPAPSPEELEALHNDMGPVFDPTPYAQAVGEEEEETDDYGDVDGAFLAGELDQPMGTPKMDAQDASSNTGDLPFWLQGDSNEAPTGMLLQDIARRGWGTKEFLMEQSQPHIPSEWVGSVNEPASRVEEAAGPSPADLFGAMAQEQDFGDLPPIEPFNFELVPTNETVDSLGFNTEELTGLSTSEHDPMTATVNLAAVADLLGGPEEPWVEERTSEPMAAMPWEESASVQVEEQPQQEVTWEVEEDDDQSTVANLEMADEEPAVAMDMGAEMDMEPAVAVEMHSEMPTMEAMDASNFAESDYSEESEGEMPTLALDEATTEATVEAMAEATAMEYMEAQEAVQESPVESYVDEVEAPVAMEAMPAEVNVEAEAEPVQSKPRKPSAPSMPTAPIGDSNTTRSWMSNATTDLSEGALADMAGEHDRAASPVTEMDLAMDGEEVSPFNYDQLDLESDEQHTGHLDANEIHRTYGTGKLAMPDEEDVLLRSRPLNDVWSEADGDASLFVTSSGKAGDETAGADASMEAEPAVEMSAQPEYDSGYLAVESEPTGYLDEDGESYGEAVEAQKEPAAAPMTEPQAAGAVEMAAHADEEFKVRVARGPWMAYTEAQNKASAMPPTTPLVAETPPSYQTPQFRAENVTPNAVEYDATGPLSEEMVDEHAPRQIAAEQTVQHTPTFEGEVKLPAHIDILVTGPLPALEGFEDMNEWASGSSQDMGTQLAMASAYAQAEDFDAALRMYRKIIRKPSTSDTMLRMIGDDLTDIEDVASHLPRYYQVVGDLLLRLGRHREAIEAYNKLK